MSTVTMSATAALIDAAGGVLRQSHEWPDAPTGFAWRICNSAGSTMPDYMAGPLRATNATALRRTPELAAFGYVLKKCGAAERQLWLDAIAHLRGREIYPADRQSFIYSPAEVLGIASGLDELPARDERRGWFVDTLRRGFINRLFRGGLPELGAYVALNLLDIDAVREYSPESINITQSSEILLIASIAIAFPDACPIPLSEIEQEFHNRVLMQSIAITDAADAVSASILALRIRDRALAPFSPIGDLDRVVALCRRFPLFADQLRTRQRGRTPYGIADEYDVQDLLHAILRIHFDDVRAEEHTPSYASTHSRVDFFLPRERMVLEAKMTRKGLGQKEVVNELTIDAARYTKMQGVETLVCLVYDPQRLCINPQGIESDIETSGSKLKVRVVVCPQGL